MHLKLTLKVLKEIEEDLRQLQGTLVSIDNEEAKIRLYKECNSLMLANLSLLQHYQKVFNRTAR